MTKIILNKDTVVNIMFEKNDYTGCGYISCSDEEIECDDCMLTKRRLDGKACYKKDVLDLLVEK